MYDQEKPQKKPQERQQINHLMILFCCTIFTIVLIGESILMKWETGAVVLLLFGIAASWVIYLTEKFSETVRIWFYFIVTMLDIFFYGIHETSIYDLAPLVIFLILMYSTTEMCSFINCCMVTYYFIMFYDFLLVLDRSVGFTSLSVSRTLFHFILVYAAGYWAKNLIKSHVKERNHTAARITELEEMNRSTEDFLTNVSHELRTPINVVTGVTAVMLKNEEDVEKRKDIISIQMAGQRLFGQIEDILDYTEIDIGRIKVSEEPYMVSSLINDIISGKHLLEREHGLELVFDVDANVPSELLGDVRKLKKIIRHLISNAMKFTKKGGVYVRLYAIPKDYGVNLCIRINDTGIGIDTENLEKICEKIFQINGGRSRSAGGLGLGLTVVYGMVAAMEGFMHIESKKGSGTMVSVSIPQKVLGKSPCMEVEARSDLCLACFLKTEKYAVPEVRDYYNETISHISQGLNVPLYRVSNIEELKGLFKRYQLTHLVVGEEEYGENTSYFEYLDEPAEVVVIAGDNFTLPQGSNIKILRKPFYYLPLVNILNASAGKDSELLSRKNMICPGVKVLVVDDEPMNLMVAEGIFKDYKMTVKTAGSGMEAIELCGNEDFDLIFLDHMMPEMDGVETLKRLRRLHPDALEPLTVIAFTANAVSGAREMFLQEGFDEFISKPIEDLELERVLRKVLPKSSIVFEDEKDVKMPEKPENPETGVGATEGEPENRPPEDNMALLESIGVNTRSGMRYSRGDKEFYVELLVKFARDEAQKASEMNDYFQKEDLENYRIRVHALKSSAKMIGADSLSEMAKSAEYAARDGDADYIKAHHEELIAQYHGLAQRVLEIFDLSGEDGAGQAAPADGAEISASELVQRLTELKEGLDTFEADKADSLITEMGGLVCRGMPVDGLIRDIKKDVDDFEFSAAAEKVEALIGKIEGGEIG